MIATLHIKNIGIIEDLSVDLNKGLNVLTGETGAGKTLIIDSLNIISGGRFSKEMIRKGENNSFVELCMYEPNSLDAEDGNIIISREINSNGKNMCKINGRMVTVSELKDFMRKYIEIHGQNDNQNLLDSKEHLKYLDGFCGDSIKEIKEKYLNNYLEYKKIVKELKENFGDEKEKQRKLDLLQYQVDEIDNANLKKAEDEELEEKRKIMQNSEKIVENLSKAEGLIENGGIDSISTSIRALEKIEGIDEKYEKVPPEGCICIDDDIFEYQGVRILGLGGSMRYRPGQYQYTEREMRRRVKKLRFKLFKKGGFDILVTHAPAYQINDGEDLPHRGFQIFRELMERYQPKYFLHGHVHLRYGRKHKRCDQYQNTQIINACERYVFEYES